MSMVQDQSAGAAPDFEWAGAAVEVGEIEERLRQAWREEAARAAEAGGPLAVRTNVLNLVVYASSPQEAAGVAAAIGRLGERHPSRTIILLDQPDAAESMLASWVHTNVRTMGRADRRLLFEQVTIAARGGAERHLPSAVDQLLISELPDFLWWLHEPPFRSPVFTRLIDMVDRLIVDSSTFNDVPNGLHELGELAVIPYGAAVSDFAWARLRPWRELIAQFFDPPEYAPSLDTIATVEVIYEPAGRDGLSGFSEGLLVLGWSCSRLGWMAGRRPVAEGAGAFRWQLTAGDRVIEAILRPEHQEGAAGGLRQVTIEAADRAPGSFTVYREGEDHLATSVNVPGAPNLDRVMRATLADEKDLLLHALDQFGRDRSYDGAIVFAAQLAGGLGGGAL